MLIIHRSDFLPNLSPRYTMRKLTLLICSFFAFAVASSAQVCPGTSGQLEWQAWQGIYDDLFTELRANPDYPAHPDVVKTLYSLSIPRNYDERYGSRVEGYLSVDTVASVQFNVTGNQMVEFRLSTDQDLANATVVASVPAYTEIAQHDAYPEQTSGSISLQPNQLYYFELIHVEGGGQDHATVYWKADFLPTTDWTIVSSSYLTGVDCQSVCPPAGTACDDGDNSTTDDQEDGYCHCIGIPSTTNTCIGERRKVEAYQYDNIIGGDLTDLYMHPDFPSMPSTSSEKGLLATPSSGTPDDAGHLIQGYLIVPVTGTYFFNVTGDDETIFFLSSDEDPANKQAHQCFVSGWSNMTEHDKYLWQTMGGFTLTAGQYYYYEINNKQGGGSTHWSAFWKTPFTPADQWKRIPDIYLYGYDCSIACIPQGTVCDDGDPYTNSDAYNDNCECVGIPCSGPDCDSPLANYVPYDKCDVTDQVDNNSSNNWLSCVKTTNPNAARPQSHWIQYDLSGRHRLFGTQVWNYNVPDSTSYGFTTAAVDYSEDGIAWTELGTYAWPLATGDSNYSGFAGPNFQGIEAQYVLITSLDNSPGCKGLSKMAFTAIECPLAGTVCDDGDPDTSDDTYNSDCECIGNSLLVNDCDEQNLTLGDSLLTAPKYDAIDDVTSVSTIPAASKVGFVGGQSVVLDVGFETQPNSVFSAAIDTCETTSNLVGQALVQRSLLEQGSQQQPADLQNFIEVIDVPENDEILVRYYIDQPGPVQLSIIGLGGETVALLSDHEYPTKGLYTKRLRTKKLLDGVYSVELSSEAGKHKARMSVMNEQ